MNVLSFSLDASILEPDKQVFGATLGRQLEMAEAVDSLHIVLRTFGGRQSSPRQFGPNLWIYPTGSKNRLSYLWDARRLGLEVCRKLPVSMITCQDPFYSALPAYALSRRLGIPLNVMIPGEILDNPYWLKESYLNRVLNVVGKWMLKRASTVRVSTVGEREQIISMGIPRERVWNVPFRVSFQHLAGPDGESLRAESLRQGADRVVLSVGRLSKEKDYLTGLLAFRQVIDRRPSTRWVIVGGGPDERILKEQVRALGLSEHVSLTGPQPYESLPDYYGASDCFMLCSTREGTAMVLLEAAYFDLPVVATDTTGARDAVKDGETGFVVPRGDCNALAARLLQLLENPAEAREMGERGRAFVQREFDPKTLVRRYLDLWYFTAGRPTPSAASRVDQ